MGCGTSTQQVPSTVANNNFTFPERKKDKKEKKKPVDEFEELTVQPLPPKSSGDEKFKCGAPSFEGDEITPCFDNGLLFRIAKDDVWAFYNDTRTYEMHVGFTFGNTSLVRALGNTKVTKIEESGGFLAETVVYPGETVMYVKGSIASYVSKIRALPISDEYLEKKARHYGKRIEPELTKVREVADGCSNENEILEKCVLLGVPFVDLRFPPEQESIAKGAERTMQTMPWARQDMYLPDGYAPLVRLFRNRVNPMNVDMGDLGDCWVMCAITTLAEYPSLVRNMFRHPFNPEETAKERAVGAYRVTLNKSGWWRNVIVDDYLPSVAGRAKYGKTVDDPCEMWVSVLEKAYAKVHGSYASIVAGDPLLALQDLTGYPTARYDESFESDSKTGDTELLERLERYDSHGFYIILSTPVKNPEDEDAEGRYKDAGLIMGRAYTVRAVRYFAEEKLGLLQIRNPWSQGVEWKGEWNDEDPKWKENPKVAEACGHDTPQEGSFWISWKDAQQYFNGCGVVMAHPKSFDYRIRGTFDQGIPQVCVQFTVKKKTYIVCTLSQEDRRGTEAAAEDYPPIMLSLCCGRGKLDPMQVEQNTNLDTDHPTNQFTFMQSRDIGMVCTLTPEGSPYLLVPRIMSTEEAVPYVLGLFCDEKIGTDVKAEFCTIPANSQVFSNFPSFSGKGKPVTTKFQVRYPDGSFPQEYTNRELVEASAATKRSGSGRDKKRKSSSSAF
ncbi:calpain cysteine peptidase [Trypanosoma grayi]|uniref:calpain cysteine peptidase n=1 Tax=Trypanosoma grayi TaxID=71804 RepID=UPI0004F44F4F|nr:calpain cysteine peptidase [Trypanosoma grayi]KEG10839.1 calpain cysteine peptidase [Trypanosoma grayi]